MQPFQSYSYDTGGAYSQPGSEHPSPQTSDFYADSYFDDSVASLAPAAYAVDPIESAYGPQAVSAGSPSVYGGSVDHNMVDAEVDMLQASGLSGFDIPGGGGGSSMATYAIEPPVAAVPPRSYSYAGASGSPANKVFASPYARRDGGGGGPMSNAFATSSRQGGGGATGNSSASATQDAFARLRAGNMSIAPSTTIDNANSQQLQHHSRSFSHQDRQQSHQQQYMPHQQAQLQQQHQQQQQQQQQQQPTTADRVRMLASMRTASSPVFSVSPGATFQSSPARPNLARPQSHHGASLVLDEQPQLAQAMHQPYPSYSLSNPVYDLYGSSYGTAESSTTPLAAYSHQQQSPQAPLAVDTKPFSHNPSVPSDPYNPRALGLPSPPPRTNGGAKTTHQHKNIYSGSGFDLVGILARVVNRRSPTIEIGAVDMSCSFVVVDARKFDTPIVYASETFARLTGYETDEIVGRNCRFLQAPGDQAVVQGEKRRYTDGNAAHHLRKHIERGEETQVSLINYHKGGKPFINLVTCVPVSMDDSGQVSYFVGFQVDLVDQPAAILDKMQNGSYIVNYSVVHATVGRNPSVISFDPTVNTEAPEESTQQAAQGQVAQALPRRELAGTTLQPAREQVRTDEPGELIASVAAQGANALVNDSMKRQFMRLLVDESDDLIHVLSLKGALLYVSGASRRLLEYEPNELLGKTLSSFCHPSDIVSVQRELKDAGVAASPTVNLVYRIRRKNSGYVWFEAQGRLHLEAGKGRKCVILSGRPREVPKMSWRDLEEEGGVGAGADEFWAKVCVDGIFLSATQSAQKMLGVSDVDSALLGKGIADLSRPRSEDAERFMSALRTTSRGEPTKVSHAMVPYPGATPINVVTRFYPARSGTDNRSKENVPAAPTLQPICGSQVTVIAQVSLASKEGVRSGRRRLSSSTVTNTASMASTTSTSVSSVPTTLDMSSTTTAANAATTASASSAGVPCPTSVVAAAVPGTGPPGLTSFSALPSTFKALTSAPNASDNVFDELNVTRGTSWQFELHQMRLTNKKLREERQALEAIMKRKEQLAKAPPPSKAGSTQRACANCGRTSSAEWRSGPTGPKTLCNACGLRWSKARSQAAQAEKKRQQAGDNKPSAAAMAHATSSGSPSDSRSGSRDSSGSGSFSTAPTTMQGSPVLSGQQQPSPQSPRSSDSIPYASPLGLAPNNVSPIALYPGMSIAPEVRPIRPPLIHQPTSKLQHGFVASSSPGPPLSLSLLPDGRNLDTPSNGPT